MSNTETINSASGRGLALGLSGPLAWRALAIAAAATIELPLLAFLYDPLAINNHDPAWLAVRSVLREGVPAAVFFAAILVILLTPRRREIAQGWADVARDHAWRAPFAINLALFGALIPATLALNAAATPNGAPPWTGFILWSAGVIGAYLILLAAAAPARFWVRFAKDNAALLLLALGAALVIQGAAVMSRQSWTLLAGATFEFSEFLLSLYEQDVVSRPDDRVLGAAGFKVNIAAACSGYEGIGLVLTFLAIYLWIFRRELRFPNAYLLLPVGATAIWVLNAVRIAMLISIGAHISPQVAITGFHSQAGWIMFLIVTISIMLAAHRLSFFHRTEIADDARGPSPAAREASALLTPFLAMTGAAILTAAFTLDGYWLYGVRVAAIAAAIGVFWRYYLSLDWRAGWTPVLIGLGVGAAWIATDPAPLAGANDEPSLGVWIAGLPPAAAAAWLTLRFIGTAILVPIAEELAFRGYLHRKLAAINFETAPEAAFRWRAFIISSAAFALLHERWLAGALAGAAFAIALYRSGKISGAIIAHMVANAVIAIWAIAMGQWSLL